MEEFLHNSLIISGRIITILPLLLFITLFMGRRSIGELPVFDYLVIITLGAVAGADIADPSIRHLETGFAIIAIGLLQRLIGKLKISKRKFGKLITFEPVIVIHKGKFLSANLKRNHYSIDNILQMLRDKQVFDVRYVELGVLEGNGMLSVQLTSSEQPVTKGDIHLSGNPGKIAFPLVMEGKLYPKVLEQFGLDQAWFEQELSRVGISQLEEIFFASISPQRELHISKKNENLQSIPPMYH
jgi:uncharacterized membrane protein YcaP (DUF421 family)